MLTHTESGSECVGTLNGGNILAKGVSLSSSPPSLRPLRSFKMFQKLCIVFSGLYLAFEATATKRIHRYKSSKIVLIYAKHRFQMQGIKMRPNQTKWNERKHKKINHNPHSFGLFDMFLLCYVMWCDVSGRGKLWIIHIRMKSRDKLWFLSRCNS